MRKLRLLLFEECEKNCSGCCNKDWNLSDLPVVMSYTGYSEIILTGGEPLLHPDVVKYVIKDIRKRTRTPIYLYTAISYSALFLDILQYVDGICLTIHEQKDILSFNTLNEILIETAIKNKSLRLNIFSNIKLGNVDLNKWNVKDNIKWIKNGPLPKNEIFMRL